MTIEPDIKRMANKFSIGFYCVLGKFFCFHMICLSLSLPLSILLCLHPTFCLSVWLLFCSPSLVSCLSLCVCVSSLLLNLVAFQFRFIVSLSSPLLKVMEKSVRFNKWRATATHRSYTLRYVSDAIEDTQWANHSFWFRWIFSNLSWTHADTQTHKHTHSRILLLLSIV